MDRIILHVDMDAFFAAVEAREHPEYRGKPLIVGSGPHERGVVSTCSYEARKFGVRSAMPSRTAYQRCPHAIFVRPDMALYRRASAEVFAVFARYTPYVEPVSVDEAFLDISGSAHLFGGARALGESLRAAVRRECGLTCSVGIAPNRLLAKIASEVHKPDGLFVMPFAPAEIAGFLAPRPIGILWGVGKTTQDALVRYGLKTCGDLQKLDEASLVRILGEAAGRSIHRHAFGLDSTPVASEARAEESVSREHTFPEDCGNREEVRQTLLALVPEVGERVRRERRWAAVARLKLRDSAFNTITRQIRLDPPACDDIAFRRALLRLFAREWPPNAGLKIRLAGFGVSNFVDEPPADLFGDGERKKRERLSQTLDDLRRRFGLGA
ncbi:MAG: DNA polymerase IV [Kiritimatiellae bacterium]|nr:DNA polymerase IV [Kiritimatiellia bacterium]